jgi:1-phosphofructokinase family hexose kinase
VIVCISPNPAIDRRVRLARLDAGEIHRARSATTAPGGKGAHVAMVSRALGESVTWVGLLGGATGEECREGLAGLGIHAVAVQTQSATRTNVEFIEDENGRVTEVREPGGSVDSSEIATFLQRCREIIRGIGPCSFVLSGSLPPGAPSNLYELLIGDIHAAGSIALLDTGGEVLSASLAAQPDVIKPNRAELQEAVGSPVPDAAAALQGSKRLIARGARNVAVSMGDEGVIWISAGTAPPLFGVGPPVKGRSTVGCGDATLAGIAVGLQRHLAPDDLVRLATACGAANCFAEMPGMIDVAQVTRLSSSVVVRPAPEAQKGVSSHAG